MGKVVADTNTGALVSSVAADVQAHLLRNPNAGDTAAGIRQWWLAPDHRWVSSDVVQAALEALVDRGLIGMRVLVSGERFYFGLDPTTGRDPTSGLDTTTGPDSAIGPDSTTTANDNPKGPA